MMINLFHLKIPIPNTLRSNLICVKMFRFCAKAENVEASIIYMQHASLKTDRTEIQNEPVRFVWLFLTTFPREHLLHLLTPFARQQTWFISRKWLVTPDTVVNRAAIFANAH